MQNENTASEMQPAHFKSSGHTCHVGCSSRALPLHQAYLHFHISSGPTSRNGAQQFPKVTIQVLLFSQIFNDISDHSFRFTPLEKSQYHSVQGKIHGWAKESLLFWGAALCYGQYLMLNL